MRGEDHSELRPALVLLVVSFLLLALQLAQIRLFSYSLFPRIVYLAIAITLLGLGAAGTIMAMLPRLRDAEPRRFTTLACIGIAVAIPVSHAAFAGLIEPRKVTALGEYPAMSPWAIGINGFASVVAAVGNLPLAMVWGFRSALLVGGALYVVALAATLAGALNPAASSPPGGSAGRSAP